MGHPSGLSETTIKINKAIKEAKSNPNPGAKPQTLYSHSDGIWRKRPQRHKNPLADTNSPKDPSLFY
jgi:hypothetical protein